MQTQGEHAHSTQKGPQPSGHANHQANVSQCTVSNIFVMLCFIYLLCDHFLVVEMTEHESLIKTVCESQVLKELQSHYRPKLSFIRWG